MVDAHYTLGNLCPSAADGESLIQAFPDLIFINRQDGTFLSCQASDRSQLYVQPEFFLNRRVQDVLPEEVASQFLNAFQDARDSRGVKEFAYCLEIGGMPQAFEARVAPCASDTFISIVRNITDHKAAEDAIRKSEMTLKAILSSTADGLLAIDQDRRILHFNERFVTIWKIPSSLLRTREDSLLLNHVLDQLKDPETFLAKVEALYQCDQEDRDILRFKDGRTIERYSLPMVMDGRISGRVWSFRDITDRVRTEIERVELERHRQLIQRAESLSRMAGSVAHHFNNKLHTILGTLEVLSRFESSREIEGHLSTAKIATQQAAEISRQLATYVGQPLDRKVPCDLNEVVEGYLGPKVESFPARIKLERVFTPERVSVEINLERFYQALANLISNAIDSFGPSSGVLRIETGACSGEAISGNVQRPIGWDPGQGRYGFISIIDSGCGIPSVSMESVCDPFFSTKAVGRGLGLPVVLGIAQAHGGGITFSSEEHGGTKVSIYLPLLETPSEIQRGTARPPDGAERDASNTILLVDDDELILLATGAMLEELGFEVLTASGGLEALKLFPDHRKKLRCVISDLTMPEMDGWQTIQALREIDSSVPIILSSGYDKAQVLSANPEVMPEGFLWKPYDLTALRMEIDRAVEAKGHT